MAMCTYVQMVTDEEIAALKDKPASINKLDKPGTETFSTYLYTTINYFLTGSAYPGKKHALAALFGEQSVATDTLENGSFDVTPSATVAKLAQALAKLDLAKVKKKIEAADWDELRDEEVDEEMVLEGSEDPAKEILEEIESLRKFMTASASKKKGLAIYTA